MCVWVWLRSPKIQRLKERGGSYQGGFSRISVSSSWHLLGCFRLSKSTSAWPHLPLFLTWHQTHVSYNHCYWTTQLSPD